MKKVRIYLKKESYDKLIKLLNERGGKAIVKEIEESVEEWKKVYSNKKNSTGNATRKKIENTKNKIEKAINQILKNNESLSLYNIAKVSKMSYNTIAKKEYKEFILKLFEKKQPETYNIKEFIEKLEENID